MAVPVAALMLGASQHQAVASIGITFWGSYLGDGYGHGPVTATAFGLAPANWFTTPAGTNVGAGTGAMTAGGLNLTWSAATTWISTLYGDPNSPFGPWNSPLPGNPEVLWGYLDDGNAANQAPAAAVSGLNALFPNGYMVQTIAANEANPVTIANISLTSGASTTVLKYSKSWHLYDWYGPIDGADKGTAFLSDPSPVLTSDTFSLQADLKGTTGDRSVLCGFIIADKPLVTTCLPQVTKVTLGDSFTIKGSVIGVGTLSYQWKRNGTDIPGANSVDYTVTNATAAADNGNYQLVATSNLYPADPSTGPTVSVTVTSQPTFSTYTAANDTDVSWVMPAASFSVNFGGDDTTFGGVTWTGTNVNGPSTFASGSGYTVGHSNPNVAWGTVFGGFYPDGSQPALLTTGTYTSGYGQIDISGLTAGHVYKANFVITDSRGGGVDGRKINLKAIGAIGETGEVRFAYDDGRYTVYTATWKASGTTAAFQPLGIGGFGTQINAFQIKDIYTSPPTPALVWDNGAANGVWSTTANNWTGVPWTNDSPAFPASFGATGAGAITLAELIKVAGMTFDAPGYSISGNTLTFDESTVTANSDATISSTLEGTAQWYKLGNAMLTIAGTNNTTGGTAIGAGTLRIGNGGTTGSLGTGNVANGGSLVFERSDAIAYTGVISGSGPVTQNGPGTLTLTGNSNSGQTIANGGVVEVATRTGDAPYTINAGGTLKLGYSTGGAYANTNLKIRGNGAASTNGLYLKGGTSYNASGGIELLDAPTTIRQYDTGMAAIGTFDINGNGLTVSAAASGSVIDANIQIVARGYGMSANIAAGAATATGDLIINGPLNVDSVDTNFGFYKRGNGSMRLNATALPANEDLHLEGGSVFCGADNCIGANADVIANAGTTLALNGFPQTVKSFSGSCNLKFKYNGLAAPPTDVLAVVGELGVSGINAEFSVEGHELTSLVYIVASYGTMIGNSFSNVTNLPENYFLDYNFNGENKIALVRLADAFTLWVTGAPYNLSGVDALPTADPDHDGLTNLIEFVIGGNPATGNDSGLLPTIEVVTTDLGAGSTDYIKFTYRSAGAAAYLTPIMQYDADLVGTWTTAVDGVAGVSVVTTGDFYAAGIDRVVCYVPKSLSVDGKLFGRISVTTP